jgi:hypothetical protein
MQFFRGAQALASIRMAESLIIPDGPTPLKGVSVLSIDHLDFFAYNAANSCTVLNREAKRSDDTVNYSMMETDFRLFSFSSQCTYSVAT